MSIKKFAACLVVTLVALSLGWQGKARAQNLVEFLREQGYSRIEITKRSFKRINFEACQDGVRYQVKMRSNGEVRTKRKIGDCRRPGLSPKEVRRKLREDGYDRIKFTDRELPRYVAEACRGERRLELIISRRGNIRDRRRIGDCSSPIDPRNLSKIIAKRGYNRIKVVDDKLPQYIVEACRRGDRVQITLNRFGEVREERRIAACRRPIKPNQLSKVLHDLGYRRIEIIDHKLPRYLAEACKGDDRVEVTLNRFGKIVDELKLGTCRRPMDVASFLAHLRKEGYSRIRYRGQDGTDFLIRACYRNERVRARYSQYGKRIMRRSAGPCRAPSLDQLAKRFADRGMKRMVFYVEGCRRGTRYRTKVDRFGDPIDRVRLGKCK